jgi:hypothetical protein
MRRFDRSSRCLAPLPTVHAAAAWFCRLLQNHGDGKANLSRYGREECDGHVEFISKHKGMEAAARGVACSKFSPTRLEGGPNSPRAARPRRVHSLLTIIKPAQEG